jgi:hypothetical protein
LYASFGMLLTSTQLHNLFVHMCVYYGARSLRTVPCQWCRAIFDDTASEQDRRFRLSCAWPRTLPKSSTTYVHQYSIFNSYFQGASSLSHIHKYYEVSEILFNAPGYWCNQCRYLPALYMQPITIWIRIKAKWLRKDLVAATLSFHLHHHTPWAAAYPQ